MFWLMLAACGTHETTFRNEQARLTCERKEECPDAASGADCSIAAPPGNSELFSCDFVEEQADACLDALPTAECQGGTIAFPPPCAMVFVNCEPI